MQDNHDRPMATYRLQFNHDFRLTNAQTLAPYFSRLGITHVYASPILRARQASTHGYDVVDPKTINPVLGDKTDLVNLVADLRKLGLALLLDIVPNHMAASIENPYWRDVLTYGHSSPFAGWFDIDWRLPDPNMWGRVLVPVLGEPMPKVIQQDQIRVSWSDGRFLVHYFDQAFPIDPVTVPTICEAGMDELRELLREQLPTFERMGEILAQLKKIPSLAIRLKRKVDIDREEIEQLLSRLAQLVIQSPRIQQWAEQTADGFAQGDEGRRRLKKLLDRQPYRLVHWRDAARAINYRRFFDINELVSVRQEDPRVFDETHATILRWVHDGLIDGLRIDHIDGLRDPLGYLDRLAGALASVNRSHATIPVFVEKILGADERLPCVWPVAGTTGYEFLNQAEAIFISPAGFFEIEQQYRRSLRRPVYFEQMAAWGKRRVLKNDLSPQVGRLADRLLRILERRKRNSVAAGDDRAMASDAESQGGASADSGTVEGDALSAERLSPVTFASRPEPTRKELVEAIVEVIVALPIYRTYVDSQHRNVSDADHHYIETALHEARQAGRAAPEAIDCLGEMLLMENTHESDHELLEQVNCIQHLQQLTGPAAAKGIEDTAHYAYTPLVSLNEVGCEPWRTTKDKDSPISAEGAEHVNRLHEANDERATTWPRSMLCVTTHDTKRTADVRARIDVLSEAPTVWTDLVQRWRRLNQEHCREFKGKRAPDAATEYLFYQTLVGIWPAPSADRASESPSASTLQELCERVEAYMLKAVREAKTHTSWTSREPQFEESVVSFVRGLLTQSGASESPFLRDVQSLVARIARPGFWNSLSRTLIQYTAPGAPDLYQGDELWNFALVDPDNRRPVDWEVRQRLLDEVITGIEAGEASRREFVRSLVQSPEDGRVKLHVIHSALAARRDNPLLFTTGKYAPLEVAGSEKDRIFAFARISDEDENRAAIVVVPRLTTGLGSGTDSPPIGQAAWSDTSIVLPPALRNRAWTCAMTREPCGEDNAGALAVSRVLQMFPVALLMDQGHSPG